ncbi:MAG: FAD-dependent oxidoreductase [Moraxellaceae bacterium]|nr:FAD-dependent oxidoreductase [Moraxellaceae bacterium]MDZ4385709.1 FAD-dependent oxidoreductase [Moraxellaceae bacterium]
MNYRKIVLVGLLILTILLIFTNSEQLQELLTLEGLKSQQDVLTVLQQASPITFAAGFFLLYVATTALSLPGAAILTLAGGAIFGFWQGLLLISFASTIGATLAFLLSRYLFQESIQQRFGEKLKTINEGIKRDGAFYLFTLRLVPVFPFFLINLLMGLTPIKTRTYYWVSQLGMLAGTIVYVNAGTQLAQIESLAGIASPEILLSFTLLGVFPLIAKAFIRLLQKRKVYAAWKRPVHFDRNLIVIGAGAAGLVTSYIAAAVKAKVTLIEAHKMGGDCLNYGCVPSKALIRSAKLAHQIRHADRYGLEADQPRFSFKQVMARVHNVIAEIAPHDSVERYTDLGVDVRQGHAKVIDPWTVEITDSNGQSEKLTTKSIVIATGASPFVPPLPGLHELCVTSDTLWERFATLDEAPKRIIVLGGGPIGCELAQSLVRLGSQVTQVEMADRVLMREDKDVSAIALAALTQSGVEVLTNHKALRCEVTGDEKRLIVSHDDVEKSLVFDEIICAVGRSPRLAGYGLDTLGIPVDRTITTNEYLETLYPNIYAAGDVAGPYQFTHTAAHQAWYAAVNALFGQLKRFKVDYRVIPWTTFLDPEIARVGLNEQEAHEQGIAVEVTRYGIDDLDRAIADGSAQGFVKVLTVPGKDRILGVTIVGEHAGDLLAEYVLAMKHGLGLNKILSTIHTYPTLSEANKYAAGEWKRAHAPERLLKWVERYHSWVRG